MATNRDSAAHGTRLAALVVVAVATLIGICTAADREQVIAGHITFINFLEDDITVAFRNDTEGVLTSDPTATFVPAHREETIHLVVPAVFGKPSPNPYAIIKLVNGSNPATYPVYIAKLDVVVKSYYPPVVVVGFSAYRFRCGNGIRLQMDVYSYGRDIPIDRQDFCAVLQQV